MRATPNLWWAADERAILPVASTKPGRAAVVPPVNKKPMGGSSRLVPNPVTGIGQLTMPASTSGIGSSSRTVMAQESAHCR
jgi:hypothetical protein